MSGDVDVLVIGGGAAGLSAALVLGRARRRVVVVDAGEPRNAPARHLHGFLSRDGLPPSELLALGRAEVRGYGVEVVDDRVEAVAPGFTVGLASGRQLTARRLLLTTGSVDGLPDLPGVRERWGRDLLHCPYCHGWEVRDQPLGVLSSVEHALLVRQWSADVVLFADGAEVSGRERAALAARGVRLVEGPVERLVVEDDRLVGVALRDGGIVGRTAVFVRPANRGRADGLAAALGVEVDGSGLVVVGPGGATNVPGVWAAGNAVDPRAQLITAAGAGSAAAIAVNADLVDDDVRRSCGRR